MVHGAATDPHFAATDVRARRRRMAEVADFVSLATDGSSIVALGAAHGGAHANSRWTIWSGTPRRVIDRPQIFYAFGGQEAGDLIDVAWDDRGPMIVGSWLGKHGLDGRIWRVEGGDLVTAGADPVSRQHRRPADRSSGCRDTR